MNMRSLALNALRIAVALAALALLYLTPVVATSTKGTSYDVVGMVIDAMALIALVAVITSAVARART